eukprot:tig00020965_g16877.t1
MMAAGPFGASFPIGAVGYYLIERNYKVKVTKGQDRIRAMYKDVEGHNPRIETVPGAREPCSLCCGTEAQGENYFASRGMPSATSCLMPIFSLFSEPAPPVAATASQRSLRDVPQAMSASAKVNVMSNDLKYTSNDAGSLARNLMDAYEITKSSPSTVNNLVNQGYVESSVQGMIKFQNSEAVHEAAFLLLSQLVNHDRGERVSKSGAVVMVSEMIERRANWYGAALAAKVFIEKMCLVQPSVAEFWANRGICDVLFKSMVDKFEPRTVETTFRAFNAMLENCPSKTRIKLQNYLKRARLLESAGKAMELNMRRPEVLVQALRLFTAMHVGNVEILTYSMTKNLCDPVIQVMAAYPNDDHIISHGKACVKILVTPFDYDLVMKTMTAMIMQKV